MRNIFIIIIISLYSITNLSAQVKFSIKGEIKGISSKTGTYSISDASAKYGRKRVSFDINNDKLNYKGELKETQVLRIFFNNNKLNKSLKSGGFIPTKVNSLWIVVSPNAKISVKGNANDYINAYPTGDKENLILANLTSSIFPIENEAVNLYVKTLENKTDSNVKMWKKKMNSLYSKISEMKMKFLSKNANSIAGLWLMDDMVIRRQISIEKVASLFKTISKKYKNLSYYKNLESRISGYYATQIGKIVPNIISSDTNDGSTFNLKSLRGKYVLLDFWGTWCGPCVSGMADMKAFRDKHKDVFQIVGIANDSNIKGWKNLIINKKLNWPHFRSIKNKNDLVAKFNIQGYPTKILIDPNGKILMRSVGENSGFYDKLEEVITK
ncbi:MAG: TlpA family protein disulfide reductase [Marinifilaceae bacterium]|jgi:thiol-disulfide isomerase/thioredoxin|nr:TlpA family protein disulfide reductase [Marinifilaceae bacterium]